MTKSLDPDAAYELWAPTYPPQPHNKLMEVEQAAMLELFPDVSGKHALDAGCGTGRYLQLLRDRNARAIGVDRSAAMLSRVNVTCPVIRGDLQVLPFASRSFDAVICGLALGDVADLGAAINELARVLRPSGRLLYSVVHPDGGPAGWKRSFETPAGQWQVTSFWHNRSAHKTALSAAGFTIEQWLEPGIDAQPVSLVVLASWPGSGPTR